MKKISLIIVTLLFLFLISCAGTQKKKDAEKKDQTTKEAVEKQTDSSATQADELAESEKDNSADDKNEAEELATAEISDEMKAAIDDAVEKAIEKYLEKAQADADAEKSSQETALATPPVVQPPVQTPPVQQPPAQPPIEENSAVSESAPSGSDTEPKKEPSPSIADGNPAPATRLESLTQMGTMPHDKEIVFSRIVRATVGQIVEIPFRGNGWVYLGEITSQRGIVYNSRRNDSDGQTFIFTLEEAGTYVLKFYRQDFIRDYILNDHVQVVAGEAPTAGAGWFNPPIDRGRVVAQPRFPSSAVEEMQVRNGTKPPSEPVVTLGESAKETVPAPSTTPQQRTVTDRETNTPQRTASTTETNTNRTPTNPSAVSSASGQPALAGQSANTAQNVPSAQTAVTQSGGDSPSAEKHEKLAPEIIMQKARESFDGGNISAAIALLDQFMVDYPGGSDEVYWQLGQYYEANSPSRNILLSLDYYRRLVNEYPQSKYFNDARRRIAYLERYYINIQ
jgi:membrane-associated HD superfamily phosphohydrolase